MLFDTIFAIDHYDAAVNYFQYLSPACVSIQISLNKIVVAIETVICIWDPFKNLITCQKNASCLEVLPNPVSHSI